MRLGTSKEIKSNEFPTGGAFLIVAVFLGFIWLTSPLYGCTNFLLTKETNELHAVIVGHTDDGIPGDPRIVFVAAADHDPLLEKRPVFYSDFSFPGYVGKFFSSAYDLPDFPSTKPIGYIDQVPHTHAYYQGEYAIMNEHQLAVAEGTCLSKFTFSYKEKQRILSIQELMRLALERCKKAKEAVLVMGALAEKYGFYGDGESVLIGDTDEGWIFEISSDPEGKSAMWVAKKVPEKEAVVITNLYRIQEVDQKDPNMLYSSNLFQIAEKRKWLKPENKTQLNWMQAVSGGEDVHPYYALRRVWRMFQRLCPDIALSPWVENVYTKEYPFSLKVEKELSWKQILNIFRDHYEGTEFDMTKGLAAGPYGSPMRNYSSNEAKNCQEKIGAWERPISYLYTVYSCISISKKDSLFGKFWFGFGEPFYTCYMPFYVGCKNLPQSVQKFNPLKYEENSPWRIFTFVSGWCNAFFYRLSLNDVLTMQNEIENAEIKECFEKEKEALSIYQKHPEQIQGFLNTFVEKNTQNVLEKWKLLGQELEVKYASGYINVPAQGTKVGYPSWWLEKAGYKEGPISYEKPKKQIK